MDITEEMIEDCVSDLSINGKYNKLYQMLINEVENQISDNRLNSMVDTLNYVGLDCRKMSKLEILFEYSKLI
ncbi:hypothetical protein UFOVP530_8 [uncultured Caudovirales phage]|uniref:Uncharacterized protein n=1 Tax=uncultured Caudovirales phage TaxID=2100421 RepID=A0A6J5QB91_9CAUD|nr:hypothetical protein UFOVP530_8 [uncultured Caudovirales phage]CAB4178801.1 hypothetical protein UFOVP1027_8 [uncultured Caudovirales phage]CAB4188374.1 hypothetical protein UFOVP1182_26 [uncultured Caudovirales phage]CAB4220611.1 hypothetical protein UFOVP1632_42 [uncultured Caudovirales phage]